MSKGNGFTYTRVRAERRAQRGYRQEYFQGGSMHVAFFPWTHYDLACDYLTKHGLALNDVGEVLVNFDEQELRDILAEEA